ncbi:HAD family phosphatase [Aestuariicoccus sp. MJ-SS9]|uniref:HAD family hydrolase n=1 Tax=Aestuariicoccus sp. MJ-SS9 TaxID=3079855 RepID=UPI0029063B0E|nr:HAD family phosphatase [Aestuariicoccus sp. MJ-SS9]MDU8910724.1 HAD family phosphatase [Aestuariicoccus sp. MJ-SS9]
MTPKAVIFDIGNVLIEWQPERFYDRVYGPDLRRAMFAEVDLHGMNDAIDRGGDFRQIVYDTAETYPHWRAQIRHWHDSWLELATPEIPHSVRLLRALRGQSVPVFALTNFGIGTWRIAVPRYLFLSEFDRHYISGEMKVIKPDPEIYAMVEADCGLAPEALLFTDDRADNIAAAAARGWQTHQFTGPQGWAECLTAHGLLTGQAAA